MNNAAYIIDICQDGVFKAVFTKDTPQSKAALTSLLSAFIGTELTVLTITTNEVPIDDVHERQLRYDISVKFNDGELANIEITVNPKPAENIRMEYHVARLYVSQGIKGKERSFRDLKPTYQLSIIAGRTIFKDEAWQHTFIYFDPVRNIALGGRTAIIAVELAKLKDVVTKPPAEMTRQERWAVYFGYYTDSEQQGLLREIEALEEGITMAEAVMKGFTQTELEALRQISRDMAELDWQEELYWAKQDGIGIGKEDGKREGVAIGKEEGIAIGQKKLIDLLESGKSLEEAKRILGIK